MKKHRFLHTRGENTTTVVLCFLFSVLLIPFIPMQVRSQQVSEDEARQIAGKWLEHYAPPGKKQREVTEILRSCADSPSALYLVNFSPGGFVVVSGDYRSNPVLGYSPEGNIKVDSSHPVFKDWLSGYAEQIDTIRKSSLKSATSHPLWHSVMEGKWNSTDVGVVLPLLTARWDQGCFYNEQCPPDMNGPCGRSWAGCTAIAMAQIMKYWKYPDSGIGYHDYVGKYHPEKGRISAFFNESEYDWNRMPDFLNASNAQVARLLFDCGVACETDYASSGSGGYEWQAANGLKIFMDYSDSIRYLKRQYYDDVTWINLLKSEIDQKRPVLYVGYNSSSSLGHSFVMDGYDGAGYFHINWGWAGQNNGYWLLDSLTPGLFNFNFFQRAVVGIQPKHSGLKSVIAVNETDSTLKYQFVCFSTGNPRSHFWDFGDGHSSTLKNPVHRYPLPGSYKIKLKVCNTGGCDSAILQKEFIAAPFTVTNFEPGGFAGNMIAFDCDNDNDLDLVMSGYPLGTWLFLNNGGTFVKTDIGIPFKYADAKLDAGDIDNDGDLDLVICGELNGSSGIRTRLYENVAGTFKELTTPFENVSGSISFVDYNNDGKLDLFLIGSTGFAFKSALYKNTGNKIFKSVENLPFPKYGQGSGSDWVDVDNDGYMDLIVCGDQSGIKRVTRLFRNNGDDIFTEMVQPFVSITDGKIAHADYDSDGDQDLLISGRSRTDTTILYKNNSGKFQPVNIDAFKGLKYRNISWGDYDNDGDPDVLIGPCIFRNDGNDHFVQIQRIANCTEAGFADVNKDNLLDITAWGGGYDQPLFYSNVLRNFSLTPNSPPSVPGRLNCERIKDIVNLSWNNSIDVSTPVEGISYNLRMGTTPGRGDIISTSSDWLSGYAKIPAGGRVTSGCSYQLKNLPFGKYYWSVQAVDNGYLTSPFSRADSFVYVANLRPVANAGQAQMVYEGTQVTLDGSGSRDPEGKMLNYKWIVPSGMEVNINASKITFTAPDVKKDTVIVFQLIVNDGEDDSDLASVSLTILNKVQTIMEDKTRGSGIAFISPDRLEILPAVPGHMYTLSVYNINGSIIVQKNLHGNGPFNINLGKLPGGIYLVVTESDGKKEKKKITIP
jgi:PKD repeat protein